MSVQWTESELDKLASAFVQARLLDPYSSSVQVFCRAQENAGLDPDRHRSLGSLGAAPPLQERINRRLADLAHPEPLCPWIIEVPVDKPINWMELAYQFDLPTATAIWVSALTRANQHPGNGTVPATPPKPEISVFKAATPPEVAKPRQLCVSIVTPDHKMFLEIERECKQSQLEVELLWVDLDLKNPMIKQRSNYVLFPNNALGGLSWSKTRDAWPKGRVRVIQANTGALVQEIKTLVGQYKQQLLAKV